MISLLHLIPIRSFFIGTLLAVRFYPNNEVSEILIAGGIIVFE